MKYIRSQIFTSVVLLSFPPPPPQTLANNLGIGKRKMEGIVTGDKKNNNPETNR